MMVEGLQWGDHQQQLGGSFERNEGMEVLHGYLVGGWTNPFEKYSSKWESSPNRGENVKRYWKPPPSYDGDETSIISY